MAEEGSEKKGKGMKGRAKREDDSRPPLRASDGLKKSSGRTKHNDKPLTQEPSDRKLPATEEGTSAKIRTNRSGRNGPTFWGPKEAKKDDNPAAAATLPGAVHQTNATEASPVRRKGLRRPQHSDVSLIEGSVTVMPGAEACAVPDSPVPKKGLRLNSPPSSSKSLQEVPNNSQTIITTEEAAEEAIYASESSRKRAAAYALDSEEDILEKPIAADNYANDDAPDCTSSQPGAYSGSPGNDPERRDNLNFSMVGAPPGFSQQHSNRNMPLATSNIHVEENYEPEIPVAPAERSDSGLVVAHPVTSRELPLQEAEAVDNGTQTAERPPLPTSVSARNKKKRINLIAACLVLITVVIILVVVLTTRGRGDDGDGSEVATPKEIYIRDRLSNETLAALNVSRSAQSRAFDWLAEDPLLYEYPDWRLQQRFALACLYYAASGDNWRSKDRWMSYSDHECEWYHRQSFGLVGVDMVGTEEACQGGRYRRLWLNRNALRGTLPLELFVMLPSLQTLSLHANNLAGTLSSAIGLLTRLEAISLANTKLVGAIPSQIGLLKNLTYLVLLANQLENAIPTELGNLGNLEFLMMDENKLTGAIPTQLGQLSAKLTKVYLQSNSLTGPLPSELGLLTVLDELQLQENALNGAIPSTFGILSSATILIAENNELTGTLPSELGLLRTLTDLDLQRNLLTGSIPSTFGQLESLQNMSLNENRLSGQISSEFGRLRNLTILFLNGNSFVNNENEVQRGLSGEIPTQLGQLQDLEYLALHNNHLQDSIPSQLGMLSNLKWVNLFDNALVGPIPSEIGELANMGHLVLGFNRLSGSIPTEIGSLATLLEIDLSMNGISGGIPSELGLSSQLVSVELRGNQISGRLPTELSVLTALTRLDVGHNLLSGETLPLRRLRALATLAFDHNMLTKFSHTWDLPESLSHLLLSDNAIAGGVPYGIFRLRMLQALALDNNQLSSTVPSELGLLANLEELHLDANNLTGTIPADLFRWPTLKELHLGSNQLYGSLPTDLFGARNLQVIDLSKNNLTSWIPWGVSELDDLKDLDLSFNSLTGLMPPEVGLLSNLRSLRLESNFLTGPIPRELEALTNLEELFVGMNSLTGPLLFAPLPDYFPGGSEPDTSETDTPMTGVGQATEPPDTADSAACSAFALPWWVLIAAYPAWWRASAQQPLIAHSDADAPPLDIFEDNELVLPVDWESINASLVDATASEAFPGRGHKLKYYSVHNNYLTGEIPPEMGTLLTDLEEFSLYDNGFLGHIPSQIGLLTKLKTFSAGGQNDFYGIETSIAPEIGMLALNGSLETFHATYLDFAGTIPESFCMIDSLRAWHHNHRNEAGRFELRYESAWSWIAGHLGPGIYTTPIRLYWEDGTNTLLRSDDGMPIEAWALSCTELNKINHHVINMILNGSWEDNEESSDNEE